MGSQPSCDPSARACAAAAVTADVPALGSTGAGARWNHEFVDVSSIFLIATGALRRVSFWAGDDPSVRHMPSN